MSNQNKVYTIDREGWDDLLGGGLISDDIVCIAGEKSFPRQAFLLQLLAKLLNNNSFPMKSLIVLYSATDAFVALSRKLKRHFEREGTRIEQVALVILGEKDLPELLKFLRKKRGEQQRLVAIFLDGLETIIDPQDPTGAEGHARKILEGLHEQAELLVYTDLFDRKGGPNGPFSNTRQGRTLGEKALVVLEAYTGAGQGNDLRAYLRNVDTDDHLSFAIVEGGAIGD